MVSAPVIVSFPALECMVSNPLPALIVSLPEEPVISSFPVFELIVKPFMFWGRTYPDKSIVSENTVPVTLLPLEGAVITFGFFIIPESIRFSVYSLMLPSSVFMYFKGPPPV